MVAASAHVVPPSETGHEVFLTTEQVAARYRRKPQTIRYWRMKGLGPSYLRLGKRVLYALTELHRFEREEQDRAAAELEDRKRAVAAARTGRPRGGTTQRRRRGCRPDAAR
ncbi:helix-turn-helix domain-containing protein [Streptomyces bohaiensis]|uniref:helix-turn-helix domain-containing protein n=1 Tax=Streptomyces bohaiensis TaxID=1431344 RepID=UPI003B7DBDCC